MGTTSKGLLLIWLKLSADLDNLTQLKDKLTNDLNTKNNILKLKEDENAKFRLENAKIIKSREILMKKMMNVDASKVALENEILKLKLGIKRGNSHVASIACFDSEKSI